MFNFVCQPISVISRFWHRASGFLFDPPSGISWVLVIISPVVTIRILLSKSMLNQQRSAIKTQQLAPEMQAIKEKYKNDQQAQAPAMRQLQREMGVNPFGGYPPVLAQMSAFIGLFHVLRLLNRTGMSGNAFGMSVEQDWNTSNYIFGVDEVRFSLPVRVLSAPLSSPVGMGEDQYVASIVPGAPADFTRMGTIIVVAPLTVIAALAAHFNVRMSVGRIRARQEADLVKHQEGPMGQQMGMMNKMMLWFFPIMVLVAGAFWHIGLLVYMVTNNVWTYLQQRYIFGKLDEEEKEAVAVKKAAKCEAQEKLAPKVGQKPISPKKGGKRQAAQNMQQAQSGQASAANKASSYFPDGNSGKGQQDPASKPASGQKPANRRNRECKKK